MSKPSESLTGTKSVATRDSIVIRGPLQPVIQTAASPVIGLDAGNRELRLKANRSSSPADCRIASWMSIQGAALIAPEAVQILRFLIARRRTRNSFIKGATER